MFKTFFIVATALLVWTQEANASGYLTAEQAAVALTDKSFDGVFHKPKGGKKLFKVYEAPDGKHHVLRPNGKFDKGREWFVDDEGKHCTTNKKWKNPRCSAVKDMGNGTLAKYDGKGRLTHTLTYLGDGNKLN